MTEPTDEELGQLLRETFADKESLVDQLPEATSTPVRRKAPILLAAAAVIVVLAGVLSIVGLDDKPTGKPGELAAPATGSPSSPSPHMGEANAAQHLVSPGQLMGVAITELTKWERPAGGWPVVKVLDASYSAASSPTEAGGKATPLSKQQQAGIVAAAVGVPIEWVQSRPKGDKVCEEADGTPYVTLGPVVMAKSGTSATIGMSIWRGCLDAQWLTYRLVRDETQFGGAESGKEEWRVAGTVGPVAVS